MCVLVILVCLLYGRDIVAQPMDGPGEEEVSKCVYDF